MRETAICPRCCCCFSSSCCYHKARSSESLRWQTPLGRSSQSQLSHQPTHDAASQRLPTRLLQSYAMHCHFGVRAAPRPSATHRLHWDYYSSGSKQLSLGSRRSVRPYSSGVGAQPPCIRSASIDIDLVQTHLTASKTHYRRPALETAPLITRHITGVIDDPSGPIFSVHAPSRRSQMLSGWTALMPGDPDTKGHCWKIILTRAIKSTAARRTGVCKHAMTSAFRLADLVPELDCVLRPSRWPTSSRPKPPEVIQLTWFIESTRHLHSVVLLEYSRNVVCCCC